MFIFIFYFPDPGQQFCPFFRVWQKCISIGITLPYRLPQFHSQAPIHSPGLFGCPHINGLIQSALRLGSSAAARPWTAAETGRRAAVLGLKPLRARIFGKGQSPDF